MILSIIIPVYNVEKYLSECLDSVFSQDLLDCEVICVNDGSTDNSREILQTYKERYSALRIIDKENGGQASARNVGLRNSKGKYIYFLDSDDFLYENAVETVKSTVTHNSDIIAFNALIGKKKYINGINIPEKKIYSGKKYVEECFKLMRTVAIPVWMYFFKRDFLFGNFLFQQENLFHEDELFTMKALFYAKSVEFKDVTFVHYRWKREGAITTTRNDKWINDRIFIAEELYNFYKTNNCDCLSFYKKVFELLILTIDMLYKDNYSNSLKKGLKSKIYFFIKKCAVTDFEKKCVKLYRIHPKLMIKYWNNSINPIVRKLINRFL